ncbi:F-box protein interaction domain protein [Medicago truncatula]|uniref:F-box protein interaction domain protein n=1 Tax=Medicago truncatula TaxID=3880 RepID=Q2HV77_MEDTR|nr:F-box protein interaction domain; Galactose oxidase, central [Medicago truncatula]AES80331.1 F-box protein interaction domain protein [Medicago truncatula]
MLKMNKSLEHHVSKQDDLIVIDSDKSSEETISNDRRANLKVRKKTVNDNSAYHSLHLGFLPHRSYPKIRGSCRGFLLLDCNTCLYLWNPSTGFHEQILVSNSNNNYFKLLFGFGYDLSSDNYIVLLGSYKYNYSNTNSIDLEIFPLRANKWEEIEFDSHLPYRNTARSNGWPRVGLFLNGTIHWLVHNHETNKDVIVAFDLKEATMSEIALPNDFYTDYSPVDYDLLVFGGLISLWILEMDAVKIRVMHEYAMDSCWTRTLVFSMHPAPHFSPISFTKFGDIVGTDCRGGFVKFNDKGQLLEHHSRGDCYFVRSQIAVHTKSYTESLLSLPGGGEQA